MNGIRATTIRLGCVGLAVALLAGAPRLGAGATTLRWKFKEGEVLRNIRVGRRPPSLDRPRTPRARRSSTTLIGLVDGHDLDRQGRSTGPQGVASVVQTIDRLRTTATLPFGKVTFDSTDDKPRRSTSPAGPLFKMLVGAEMSPRS